MHVKYFYSFAKSINVPIHPMEQKRIIAMDEKTLKKISDKIRSKRIEMGYSQEYMANQLGISQNVYSQNERNIASVPFSRVLKMTAILNISFVQLMNI
ncbi:XRE family transcriptional regulator [Pedobacter chinensis]|uniref:XRE family transcriptional regulator n=1 Tax=Pedobacter chinensis TaxID=2282421 RepID=A0A369PTY6_9SPHI|nr:helix-turn-helix transcriptional regulator [Pedobacter chinensis]RDC54427.1 XRE family transcriptional regulator [Pedobacter chinensis]